MSARLSLPPGVHAKLSSARRRVRRQRLGRGVSLWALALTLGAGAALLADLAYPLPATARAAVLTAWLGAAAAGALAWLVLPLLRRVRLTSVAAALEEQ